MDDPFIYGLLIVLFFIFQLLRSAFSSINQLQLELDKKKGLYHSSILNYISLHTQDFITTTNIFYFTILIVLISTSGDILTITTVNNFFILLLIYIGIIAILLLIVISLKTLGEYFPNEIINILAFPIILFHFICLPVTKTFMFLSRGHLKDIQESILIEQKTFSKQDLNKLVTDNERHRSSDEEVTSEIKLFKNALEFSEIKLRECMIPRTEIVAIEINDLNDELLSEFIKTGLSKIIVFRDNIDNIFGYVTSKSLLSNNQDFRKNIKNISIFPESMPANKLLRHFIKKGQTIAVIVDEFGGTSGIVTIEDILEEIFGEIKDEHDTNELYEKQLSENDFIFSGRLEIDYLNEKYGLQIPEDEEYETIAGFIINHTEKLPDINDHIEIDNFFFNILKVSDTRVELVKLEILDKNQ